MVYQIFHLTVICFPGEGGGKQSGCVQGLEQVVAGRSQEARLALVRLLGHRFGFQHLLIDDLELLGTSLYPLFQVNVRFLQGLLGSTHGGNILEGRDIATPGDRTAINTQNGSIGPLALIGHWPTLAHAGAAVSHDFINPAGREVGVGQVVTHQIFDWASDPDEAFRIGKQLQVTMVPDHQLLLMVHH